MNAIIRFLMLFGLLAQSVLLSQIKTGAETFMRYPRKYLNEKSVAVVTNHTGLLPNGEHIVDSLVRVKTVSVKALFAPEHGIRGNAPAGSKINNSIDSITGIPVYSLYGNTHKPTKEMLEGIDVVVFDMQDVGARFYTYISTLFYVMQACAEQNKKLYVLDRPNPLGGKYIAGPIIKKELESFVGIAPIPIAHGMTIGELAMMFNDGYLPNGLKANLEVIPMVGWKRSMNYDQTGFKWIAPSPNLPTVESAYIYPGTCFLEGTNISEGRGTESPFLTFGAPFINTVDLLALLKEYATPGITFEEVEFTPKDIPGKAKNPKFKGVKCFGLKARVTNPAISNPVYFGAKLLMALHKLYPDKFKFKDSTFDRLWGDKQIRLMILAGKVPVDIRNYWQEDFNKFKEQRKKYLLYQ